MHPTPPKQVERGVGTATVSEHCYVLAGSKAGTVAPGPDGYGG